MNIKKLSKSELLSIRGDIDSQLEYLDSVEKSVKAAVKKNSKKTKLSELDKNDMIFCIIFNGSRIYNMDYVNINFYKEERDEYKEFTNFSTSHPDKPMGCSSCVRNEVMDNSYFLSEFTSSYRFFTMNPKNWKEDLNSEMIRLIKLKDDEHRENVANIERNIQAQINSTEVDRYIEEFLDN